MYVLLKLTCDIFKQFDLIYTKLNRNGYLIIEDFDPLFHHTNYNKNYKNIKSYKMRYDIFLEQSGLFELIYKKRGELVAPFLTSSCIN